MTRSTNLREIAKVAGVSLATASRALNDAEAERVSPQRAARVKQVAQQLGYIGGYHRKTLRTRRAETLGVALDVNSPKPAPINPSVLTHPFFAQMVAGVEQVTHARGYNLAMVVPTADRRANQRGVDQVRELRIDGLVLLPVGGADNDWALREAPDLPIVAIRPSLETALPVVGFDAGLGIRLAVEHLASLGHRDLLYYGPKHHDQDDRYRHFEKHAAGCGCRGRVYRQTGSRHFDQFSRRQEAEEQVAAFEAYLADTAVDFTAVVCFSDLFAVSACRVLERRGLRVPVDVSVTGIDNLEPALMRPQLTSVDLRLMELGLRAGQLVLEMVDGGKEARQRCRGKTETIRPRLYIRESTAPPPR